MGILAHDAYRSRARHPRRERAPYRRRTTLLLTTRRRLNSTTHDHGLSQNARSLDSLHRGTQRKSSPRLCECLGVPLWLKRSVNSRSASLPSAAHAPIYCSFFGEYFSAISFSFV